MEIIKFNAWKKENFLDELQFGTNFYFDDVLCNNIEEFFKFILKNSKSVNLINLHKFSSDDKIDLILLRKCRKFFTKYFKEFLSLNIKFVEFTQEEICDIISDELYFLYCNKYNIKYCKTEKLILNEKNKLDKFAKPLFKYNEFDVICKFFIHNDRYLYFNFPVESGIDRFVFYFLINTQDDKDEIIELFKNCKINLKCLDMFSKIEICENGSLYAVGFNYDMSSSKLIRTTLYSRFNIFSKNVDNSKFLNKYFDLNYDFENDNKNLFVKDWGIDYFEDGNDNQNEVLKIYFKEINFKSKINSENELIKILENKPSVACYKFCNKKLIDKKYEFSNNLFDENEIKVLEKLNIYNKNSKLFSIYFDENENLKNSVNYNI